MYDAFVGLGYDCQTAHQLEMNGLKGATLPFDRVVTPFSSVYQLLENDFSGFLDRENLILVEDEKSGYYVEDRKYRIRFLHDFPLTRHFMQSYNEVRLKYRRRSNRLLQILNSGGKIVLIRVGIAREDAETLDRLLHGKFPGLSYVILALDNNDAMRAPWGLERVVNLHLPQAVPYAWTGLDRPWRNALAGVLGIQNSDQEQWELLGGLPLRVDLAPSIMEVHARPQQTVMLAVQVTNRSDVPLGFGRSRFSLSYHLLSHDNVMLQWDNQRSNLRQVLQPAETRIIDVAVKAPDRAGAYQIEIDVVWEDVQWLKDGGNQTSTVHLTVL